MESLREHAGWTELLQRYVSGGLVDYASLKRDGQPALDAARVFVRDRARNRYDPASRTLSLSSIFLEYDWSLNER